MAGRKQRDVTWHRAWRSPDGGKAEQNRRGIMNNGFLRDKEGKEIKPGDILRNEFNDPPEVDVLGDDKGALYLGDYDSPLERYLPDVFWKIVNR